MKWKAEKAGKNDQWMITNHKGEAIAYLYNEYLAVKVSRGAEDIRLPDNLEKMMDAEYIKASYSLYEDKIVQSHTDKVVGRVLNFMLAGEIFDRLNQNIK